MGNGEIANDILNMIAADNLVACDIHARGNSLLYKPDWKRLKHLEQRDKTLLRL